jgi:hypothetical protein
VLPGGDPSMVAQKSGCIINNIAFYIASIFTLGTRRRTGVDS